MVNGLKVTALLTGRGNNTLRDKNVLEVLGKPLLYYPANAARKSSVVDAWHCSSDDEKILAAAEENGYGRIVRPAELALPTSQHIECIQHALGVLGDRGELPDILIVILANNVTIRSGWITDCVMAMAQDMTVSAVVPVYQDNDHHPLRAKRVNADGSLAMYEQNVSGKVSTNRQDLPRCYFLAHNFWVLNVRSVLSGEEGQPPWTFMGNRILPYEIEHSIDIHDRSDLHVAKSWIEDNYTD